MYVLVRNAGSLSCPCTYAFVEVYLHRKTLCCKLGLWNSSLIIEIAEHLLLSGLDHYENIFECVMDRGLTLKYGQVVFEYHLSVLANNVYHIPLSPTDWFITSVALISVFPMALLSNLVQVMPFALLHLNCITVLV